MSKCSLRCTWFDILREYLGLNTNAACALDPDMFVSHIQHNMVSTQLLFGINLGKRESQHWISTQYQKMPSSDQSLNRSRKGRSLAVQVCPRKPCVWKCVLSANEKLVSFLVECIGKNLVN